MNVLDMESVKNFSKIKKEIHIPIVADIHFSHEWAIEAVKQGVDKLRINPGNIGGMDKVKAVVEECKEREVPIRIGVNAGSLEKDLLAKYKHPTPKALVESASRNITILEDMDFDQIVVSIKTSNVPQMVAAYELFSSKYDYPVHLGVTEAGPPRTSTIKSSIGIGSLLLRGIGDTIRVSMTGESTEEILIGQEILKHLGLRAGPKLISCPTCSRTRYDMRPLVKRVEEYLRTIKSDITVAVMGCVVNGPGEAREADVGIAGGSGKGVLFVRGDVVKNVREEEMFDELVQLIQRVVREKKSHE